MRFKSLLNIRIIFTVQIVFILITLSLRVLSISKTYSYGLEAIEKSKKYESIRNKDYESEYSKILEEAEKVSKTIFLGDDRMKILNELENIISEAECQKKSVRFIDSFGFDSEEKNKNEILSERVVINVIGEKDNLGSLMNRLIEDDKKYKILVYNSRLDDDEYLAEIDIAVNSIHSENLKRLINIDMFESGKKEHSELKKQNEKKDTEETGLSEDTLVSEFIDQKLDLEDRSSIVRDLAIDYYLPENCVKEIYSIDGKEAISDGDKLVLEISLFELGNCESVELEFETRDSSNRVHVFTTGIIVPGEKLTFEYDMNKYNDIVFPINLETISLSNVLNESQGTIEISSFDIIR